MSTMQLEQHENLREWLKANLKNEMMISGSVLSNKKELKMMMNRDFKCEKGIYFWFLKFEKLAFFLSSFAEYQIDETLFFKVDFHGDKYVLVYLGTAGVRNNKGGNKSSLLDRLNWHLFNAQSDESVSSGHMSTLRRTLGALISDDLTAENTQEKLSVIIRSDFIIFFLPYGKECAGVEFLRIQKVVSDNEKVLIECLTPIFNLSQNPNRFNPKHITYKISERRKKVEKDTKERIGLKVQDFESRNLKRDKIDSKNSKCVSFVNDFEIYHNRLKLSDEGCMEFNVKQHESISTIIKGIDMLPKGYCKFEICDSENPNMKFNEWQRKTGKKGQNFYSYFDAMYTQKSMKRADYISNWMIENNINEIKVVVCLI